MASRDDLKAIGLEPDENGLVPIKVEVQETAGHASLGIPRERLEAIAHEVTTTGIEDMGVLGPTPQQVMLENKWGDSSTRILVRRVTPAQFHLVFMTLEEAERLGG